MAHNFKKLIVWQKSMDLADSIYSYIKKLPDEERFALQSQLRRAVISIPSNIAEGLAKNSVKEFKYYLSTSLGSSFEIETQLLICQRQEYHPQDVIQLLQQVKELQNMIFKYKESLKS